MSDIHYYFCDKYFLNFTKQLNFFKINYQLIYFFLK